MRKSKKRNNPVTDLRARLTQRGLTIAGWARVKGWSEHTVRSALAGRRLHGRKSQMIRDAAKSL